MVVFHHRLVSLEVCTRPAPEDIRIATPGSSLHELPHASHHPITPTLTAVERSLRVGSSVVEPKASARVPDGDLAPGALLLGGRSLRDHLDGRYRGPLLLRAEPEGGRPGVYRWNPDRPRLGDTLLAIDGEPIASYSNYIQAMRSIGVEGRSARSRSPGERARRGDEIGDGDGPLSSSEHLHLVAGLVRAGDVDLRRRRPGLLEAAGRCLRPALLLALHRDGRRLHGGISLDGDRRRADADLSVRPLRGVRAGGQPPFLSGLPPAQSDLRQVAAGGAGGALRGPLALPGGALGEHAPGTPARRAIVAAGRARRCGW